jgi:hypothetical protein
LFAVNYPEDRLFLMPMSYRNTKRTHTTLPEKIMTPRRS